PPTHQFADDRYVTVAWGRDYADVPPLRGIIYTDARESTITVSVDVAPIPPDVPPAEPGE
ncbi:transglutaminase family protein, partial [Nocardia tengchongensis]